MIPATTHLQIGLFGGPSFIAVEQGIVTTVNVIEAYPYDSATFASADSSVRSRTPSGSMSGGSYCSTTHRRRRGFALLRPNDLWPGGWRHGGG